MKRQSLERESVVFLHVPTTSVFPFRLDRSRWHSHYYLIIRCSLFDPTSLSAIVLFLWNLTWVSFGVHIRLNIPERNERSRALQEMNSSLGGKSKAYGPAEELAAMGVGAAGKTSPEPWTGWRTFTRV